MTQTTAFELLLGELADKLSPTALAQARAVFAGWAGQRIDIPSRRALLAQDAERAARDAVKAGACRREAVQRVMGMGLGKSSAYRVVQRAIGG